MPEDYYGDDDAPAPETAPAEDQPGEDTEETKTALIDSSICPGMEPGDEMVVKIEKVMDKEYLVSYAPEPGKEEESSEEAAPAAEEKPEGSMSSMMY